MIGLYAMKKYENSIEFAFDKFSNKVLDINDIKTQKEGFEIRKQYSENSIELYCCECHQKLTVSSSKKDNIHFKHKPNHSYCLLTDNSISCEDNKNNHKAVLIKESPRHKKLKNKIGNLLKVTKGVDVDSICIDNKFIERNGEKRKPDVFCEYNGKKLVFEIQLSQLSLSYILSRYDFYRKNGFYLIWILDNLDITKKNNLTRDIKYQNTNQNLFYLDENSDNQLRLICKYKKVWINKKNCFQEQWCDSSIFLDNLKFDNKSFQVFFYDYDQHKYDIEKQIKQFQIQQQRLLERKIKSIKMEIEDLKKKSESEFVFDKLKKLSEKIFQLNNNEIEELNKQLNLYHGYPKALNKWITMIKDNNTADFVQFILQCTKIELNINKLFDGKTVFQAVLLNDNICHKEKLIKELFKRNYSLTENDRKECLQYAKFCFDKKKEVLKYEVFDRLSEKRFMDDFYNYERLLHVIESAKKKEIVGFKYQSQKWLDFGNNIVINKYYHQYWQYIEYALKYYGAWNNILELDKKGTFKRYLQDVYNNMPIQNIEVVELLNDLYPELEL